MFPHLSKIVEKHQTHFEGKPLYEDLASLARLLVIHPSMELRASLSGAWVWTSTCDVIHYGGGGQRKDVGCSIN